MSKSLQIIFSVVAALALILSGIGLFQTEPLISPMSGAVAGETNFTQLGIGFDEAVDYQLTFYGNAQDYYFGLDDSVDDLLIGLGSVMGTTPAFGVDENLAITTYGDLTFGGTTPVLTIGDAGAEDTAIVFDGIAQDYYIALDDGTDDLLIGLGSAVGTTPGFGLDENLAVAMYGDVTINGTTPVLTIGDAAAEDTALVYNGIAQDYYIALDDGTDDLMIGLGSAVGTTPGISMDENLAVATYGDVTMTGATPVLTIGDAGEEDAAIVYDGAAQDYYIALDDGTDDLLVGLGSAVGTTPAFGIDENLVTTWSGGTLVLNEIVSAANVLGADECGKTMFLNNAAGFASTLPAASTVSAGCSFTFIVATAPITAAYTIISANTLENVLYGGINELEVDTNDDGPTVQGGDTITLVQNLAVIGDYVYLISDGTFYYFWGQTAVDGGSTAAGS